MSGLRKKNLSDINVKGKRVLARVDFNVPVEDGVVKDDTRITASLPTIRHALKFGASLVLMSHLGRPRGNGPEPEFSLAPVARRLAELLGVPVKMLPDCVGPDVEKQAAALKPGEAALLENVRFYKAETDEKKPESVEAFAKKLAVLGNVYVNDAFGTAHRAHASTTVVAKFIKPAVAGFLMQKELDAFSRVLEAPKRPLVAILGGAKVSDKIKVIEHLLDNVDALLIGGGMAYTFMKAQGLPVGASLVETGQVDVAKAALAKARAKKVDLRLPEDHVVADKMAADARVQTVGRDKIPDGWMGLDIGPATCRAYAGVIAGAKTVVWNGPMGVFEMKPFAAGTLAIARAMAASGAVTVIGGGDSVRAVNESGLADKMTHISTGGGASLELMEGRVLPGVAALDDK